VKLGLKSLLDKLRSPWTTPAVQFDTRGIHLFVDGLADHKDARNMKIKKNGTQDGRMQKEAIVLLSRRAAMLFARDVDPSSCIALQSGRLAKITSPDTYELHRSGAGWLLTSSPPKLFFNFLISRWQPCCLAKAAYSADVKELLYVAFTPVAGRPALFVKLGYRELPEGEDEAELVTYVEKKSQQMRLTNVDGAGIFIFEVPESHGAFARPCRAGEASLIAEFLHSDEVLVKHTSYQPQNAIGDFVAFSSSLEYLFVESPRSFDQPLVGLTRLLRSFTGNPALMPWRPAAAEGEIRRGRKRLAAWPASL